MPLWRILMEQIKLTRITDLETPCFILDKAELERSIYGFKDALDKHFSKNIIGYSVKTNSLPYCMCLAREMGCYAEVVSHDEYELALLCGYSKDRIIYNGPMKSKGTFLDAIIHGAVVNLEAKREIEWLQDLPKNESYNIGIRVNINISKVAPNDAIGDNDFGRFGFSDETEELQNAFNKIKELNNIKISGLHLHRSPHTRSVNFYKQLIAYASQIIRKYNLKLDYIDIGGGYFGIFKNKPTYENYSDVIYDSLKEHNLEKLNVIVEPGMAILGSSFSFVSKIIDSKQIEPDLYIHTTDGSRNDIDPLFKKDSYLYEIIKTDNNNCKIVNKQIITGCSCIEFDKIFTLDSTNILHINDLIIYKNVGAYTMCLSPLFIRYFPYVYLLENGIYQMIRDKWSANEYIQKSKLK